ncbi:MAG: hypothetical protein C4297_03150 [Gemmataceae bacterium]
MASARLASSCSSRIGCKTLIQLHSKRAKANSPEILVPSGDLADWVSKARDRCFQQLALPVLVGVVRHSMIRGLVAVIGKKSVWCRFFFGALEIWIAQ